MMEKYEELEISVIFFEGADVITSSDSWETAPDAGEDLPASGNH